MSINVVSMGYVWVPSSIDDRVGLLSVQSWWQSIRAFSFCWVIKWVQNNEIIAYVVSLGVCL